MSLLAAHPGLVFLVVCFALALGLVVAGALRVVRTALRLRTRVEGYADLPLRQDVARAEDRLALTERRAAGIPALLARARTALLEIQAARARIALIAATLRTALRFVRSLLSPS